MAKHPANDQEAMRVLTNLLDAAHPRHVVGTRMPEKFNGFVHAMNTNAALCEIVAPMYPNPYSIAN